MTVSFTRIVALHISIHGNQHGALSLTRFSLSISTSSSCLSPVFLFLELTHTKSMANLRCSAAEKSEDTLNVFHCSTGYEPNLLTFDELNDSSVTFSFMIPSTDQDVDDVTLGEMPTAAHRGQVDHCVPGGMSVSQSVVVCNVRWIRAT